MNFAKNMNNSLKLLQDKILLKKRTLIETVDDELKNNYQIEHTKHRSFKNWNPKLKTRQDNRFDYIYIT